MIFDTHAHCYWNTLEPRIDEVFANMQKNWVIKATQIGCDISTSVQAISLARRFPGVFYATVWLHPETAQDNYEWIITNYEWESKSRHVEVWGILFWKDEQDFSYTRNDRKLDTLETLEQLIQENRDIVVAVGECGFDFHYLEGITPEISEQLQQNPHRYTELLSKGALEQIENQKYWWLEQWKLAQKYNLPLVIHTRDARDATLEFMKKHNINRCVMHCYSEDWDFARELLDFSDEIYFSFSGILTYKKSEKIQEAAKNIPLERILVETDAPFLAPQAVRGKVNEPAYTRYTLEKLAELRWVRVEDIEDRVYENSIRFYGLKISW